MTMSSFAERYGPWALERGVLASEGATIPFPGGLDAIGRALG
jgi:hypothetical protein